jgi:hypothetical protein
MEVGKAKYGSGKNVFKVEKDKDNVFRVLPPLGKLAKKGRWYQYYRVEWGYKGTDGKQRPFQDVRKVNFNTKMVEVESAAHLRREAIKAKQEEIVKAFRAGTATKEQVEEIRDLSKRYNLDSKYYVNAVSLDGKIGLLKINSTQMNMLKAEIDKLLKSGIDPLGLEAGIYFNFTKSNATGMVKDWTFSVAPHYENQADGSLRRVTHTMDQTFIDRLSGEAFELSGMYPMLTPGQVEQLVKAGDNHGALVDEFLGKPTEAEAGLEESNETEAGLESAPVETQAESAPVESAPAAESAPVETQAADTTAEAAPVGENGEAMSDDDFLKSIGAI